MTSLLPELYSVNKPIVNSLSYHNVPMFKGDTSNLDMMESIDKENCQSGPQSVSAVNATPVPAKRLSAARLSDSTIKTSPMPTPGPISVNKRSSLSPLARLLMSASKTMRATPHMARSPDFCSASAYRLAAPSSVLSRYSCAQDILADVEINLEADLAGMDLSCLTCSELNKKIQALEGNASETQRELTAAKQSMEVSALQLYSTQNQACIEKLQLLVKTQSDDLINAHEDVLTYNERHDSIVAEGRALYETFEVKLIRIATLEKHISAIKAMVEPLELEHIKLRGEYDTLYQLYTNMHENALEHSDAYDASQVQLESAYEQIRILRNGSTSNVSVRGHLEETDSMEEPEFLHTKSLDTFVDAATVTNWEQRHCAAQTEMVEVMCQYTRAQAECQELTLMKNQFANQMTAQREEIEMLRQKLSIKDLDTTSPSFMPSFSCPPSPSASMVFVESSPTELLQAHETIEAMSSEIEDLKAELMELKTHSDAVELSSVVVSEVTEIEAQTNEALIVQLRQTNADLNARVQSIEQAGVAIKNPTTMSSLELSSHSESLAISNELLRSENGRLVMQNRQAAVWEVKAQACEGYAMIIARMKTELNDAHLANTISTRQHDEQQQQARTQFSIERAELHNESIDLQKTIEQLELKLQSAGAATVSVMDRLASSEKRELQLRESTAAAELALKNGQEDLRMLYRRHQAELGALQQQLDEDPHRLKYGAAMEVILLLKAQIEDTVALHDITMQSDEPLASLLIVEAEAIIVALQQHVELVQADKLWQQKQVEAANSLVALTETRFNKVSAEILASTAALHDLQSLHASLSVSLATSSTSNTTLVIQLAQASDDREIERAMFGERIGKLQLVTDHSEMSMATMQSIINNSVPREQFDRLESELLQGQTKIKEAEISMTSLETQLSNAQDTVNTLTFQLAASERHSEIINTDLNMMQDELHQSHQQLETQQMENADLVYQLSTIQLAYSTEQDAYVTISAELSSTRVSLATSIEKIDVLDARLLTMQNEIDDTQTELLQSQQDIQVSNESLEVTVRRLAESEAALAAECDSGQIQHAEADELTERVSTLNTELVHLMAQREQASFEAAEFQSLIHTLTSERDEATALLEDERTVSDEVQQEMKSDLERAQRLHTSTDQQLTTVQQELNTLTTIYQEFQQQHERLSSNSDATLQTLRLECERVQGELQQLQSDKEAVESDLHEQIVELEEQVSSLAAQLKDVVAVLKSTHSELTSVHTERTAADSISAETIAQMEVQLEEIESALLCSRQSLETRTEELATSRMSASTSQTAAADSLAYVHQQLQDTQQHAAIIEQQLNTARVEIADLKTTSKTASDALASIRHSYDELEQRHDDIGDSLRRQTSQSDLALRTLQLQCDEGQQQMRAVRDELAGVEGQLSAAESARRKLISDAAQVHATRCQTADTQVALDKSAKQVTDLNQRLTTTSEQLLACQLELETSSVARTAVLEDKSRLDSQISKLRDIDLTRVAELAKLNADIEIKKTKEAAYKVLRSKAHGWVVRTVQNSSTITASTLVPENSIAVPFEEMAVLCIDILGATFESSNPVMQATVNAVTARVAAKQRSGSTRDTPNTPMVMKNTSTTMVIPATSVQEVTIPVAAVVATSSSQAQPVAKAASAFRRVSIAAQPASVPPAATLAATSASAALSGPSAPMRYNVTRMSMPGPAAPQP